MWQAETKTKFLYLICNFMPFFFFLNHPLQLSANSNNRVWDTSCPCHLVAALLDNVLTG